MTFPTQQDVAEDVLPIGWEKMRDPHGKIYYCNHVSKTNQWVSEITVASGIFAL